MPKEKFEKPQPFLQLKQEQTNLQKIASTLFRLFVEESTMSPEISQALVSSTYFQILEVLTCILLWTLFLHTNSNIYSIIVTCLSILLFVLDIIPKISQRHFLFNFVSIAEGLVLISMTFCGKILIDNYVIFTDFCSEFVAYYEERVVYYGPKDQVILMCTFVTWRFLAEIIYMTIFTIGKVVHLGLYFRAYRQAKQKYEEEERKKRRKDRYNEMVRKRYVFDEKRKV